MNIRWVSAVAVTAILFIVFQNCDIVHRSSGGNRPLACEMIGYIINGPADVYVGDSNDYSVAMPDGNVSWTLQKGDDPANPIDGTNSSTLSLSLNDVDHFVLTAQSVDTKGCDVYATLEITSHP